MTSATPTPRDSFITIQALRGVAALMVVFFHCLDRWAEQKHVDMSQIYCNYSVPAALAPS